MFGLVCLPNAPSGCGCRIVAPGVLQVTEHHVYDVCAPLIEPFRLIEFLVENPGQRVSVGQIKIGERRDRQIKVHRIDVAAEHALGLPAFEKRLDGFQQRHVQRLHRFRLLQVVRVVNVLDAHQTDEIGRRDEVIESVGNETAHALDGRQISHLEITLIGAQAAVDGLQDLQVQRLFVVEVVVDQIFVEAGLLRDAIDSSTVSSLSDEASA